MGKKKNYGLFAAISTVFIIILELLDKSFKVTAFSEGLSGVLAPVLFIALFVFTIFKFKDELTFHKKWSLIPIFILATFVLSGITAFFANIVDFYFKGILSNLLYFAGYAIVLAALLKESFKKYLPVGFIVAAVCEVFIVTIGGGIAVTNGLMFIVYALLCLMCVEKFGKIKNILRWIVIVLAFVSVASGLAEVILTVMLAVFIAPIGKTKMNFSKVVAILFIILCIITLTTSLSAINGNDYIDSQIESIEESIEYYQKLYDSTSSNYYKEEYREEIEDLKEQFAELFAAERRTTINNFLHIGIPGVLFAAAFICLAVVFWSKKYGKLSLISCGIMACGLIISLFSQDRSVAYWNFDLVNYPFINLFINSAVWSILLFVAFAVMFIKREEHPVKTRIGAMLLSVITVLSAFEQEEFIAIYGLFALTMICASLVLVPLKYKDNISVGQYIFFTIITLGIWNLIWVYNTTKFLCEDEEKKAKKSTVELLLYMFLPFYSVYWYYKRAERIDAILAKENEESGIKILSLIFGVTVPIVSGILIQDKINQIVEIRNN